LWTRGVKGGAEAVASEHAAAEEGDESRMSVRESRKGARAGGVSGGGEEREERLQVWEVQLEQVETVQVT